MYDGGRGNIANICRCINASEGRRTSESYTHTHSLKVLTRSMLDKRYVQNDFPLFSRFEIDFLRVSALNSCCADLLSLLS